MLDVVDRLVPWLSGALVVLGVFGMSLGVVGLIRLPDLPMKLHAASTAASFGAVAICLSAAMHGDLAIAGRVGVIAALLLVTTPVSSHVIAQAAYTNGARR